MSKYYWAARGDASQIEPGFKVPKARPRLTPTETVFEQVRKEQFPALPSRLNCMYVCPELSGFCRPGSTDWDTGQEKHIFEVQVRGDAFLANAELFTKAREYENDPSYAAEIAESYWKGQRAPFFPEVLVDGSVTVIRRVSPEQRVAARYMMRQAEKIPMRGSKHNAFFFGNDRGNWGVEPLNPGVPGRFSRGDAWYMYSSSSRPQLMVEGATEHHSGFRKALKEIVSRYPELQRWQITFDGPYKPVVEVLGLSSKINWSRIKLYHGTSSSVWYKIKADGLKPRGETNVEPVYGSGVGAAEGHAAAVYLTSQDGTSHFAAIEAAKKDKDPEAYPIVIEVTGLDPTLFGPDEDSREPTAEMSLARTGGVAYFGTIPPNRISAYSYMEEGGWYLI